MVLSKPRVFVWGREGDIRHGLAVRCPVRVLYIVQDFSWSTPAQGHPCKCSSSRIAAKINGVEPNRQLSSVGDRKQFCTLQPDFARARIVGARKIQLVFASLPRGAVNNAPVGRKSG